VRRFDRSFRLIIAAQILFASGFGLYYQLILPYALKLGASRFTIGVLFAVWQACTAIGFMPGAWAAKRFRLKRVIVGVWWLTVPAAACFALAPSWPWLIPGFVLSGFYMANNPAFKSYIYLKSEPGRVARNMAYIFGAYPIGLIFAPLLGGYLAHRAGMRWVFALSIVLYAASATVVSLIEDTPYHTAESRWTAASLFGNRLFRRYVAFFFAGFLAVYLGQPFLTPFLKQVHHQGYTALGVYAALMAFGAAVMCPLMGQATDRFGPRLGAGAVLGFLAAGALLLITGDHLVVWGAAMLCYGAFDTFRFITNGIIAKSFGDVPLAWGYAIFDSIMGIPSVIGGLLGGYLYSRRYQLPFVVVIGLALALVVAIAATTRRGGRQVAAAPK
jgi:MFS family permease